MSPATRSFAVARALVRQGRTVTSTSGNASFVRKAARASSSPLRHNSGSPAAFVVSLTPPTTVPRIGSVRTFSDAGKAAPQEEAPTKEEEETASKTPEEGGEKAATDGEADETPATKEEELEAQVKDLKDQLLRSLAEQENTRRIAKRDVSAAKSFAVTSFAKSLLDTSDNLSRALESVPSEYRADMENHPVLATLYEGIKMTDDGLTKAFAKNGLTKFGEAGEKFDPNLHEALYEYPDPAKEEGTVGQVMKVGFMLNNRVVRPAEVGVVKKA
mmetsp:Transcript_530/g.692  ORF Transcript_530/g.692 Transcript_530/m.692 type:complete len:273 (-) Transcript_530:287-1105(-)